MRRWLRSNVGLGCALVGGVVALFLFIVPGGAALTPVNLVLSVLLGATFAGSMYLAGRAQRLPPR
jgi:hypothetical protein